MSLLPTTAFAKEYGDGDEGGVQMSLTVEGTIQYTVNVSASPANYGTVTGGGTYDENTTVTVTATPKYGYIFTGWLENGEKVKNAGASYTFTATADRNLIAVFEARGERSCHLIIEGDPYFNVIGTGFDADRPADFYPGEMVTVTAVPKHAGVRFSEWWQWDYDPENPNPSKNLVSKDASYSFNIEKDIILSIGHVAVQVAHIEPGEGSGESIIAISLFANKPDEDYIFYTSDDEGNLQFHFPPADCFTAPEGKVFDCWELDGDGIGYPAGDVQTVLGNGANPAFADKKITITAKWKNDDSAPLSCVISVPARIDIPYKQEFTPVKWSVDSLDIGIFNDLHVIFHDGDFSNEAGKTIHYYVKDTQTDVETYSQANIEDYLVHEPSEFTTQVCIPTDEWEAAAPGQYTATLRFEIKGVH